MVSHGRSKWTEVLKDLPKPGWRSRAGTPTPSTPGTPNTEDEWIQEKKLLAEERKREKRKRRKKAEIYVSLQVPIAPCA